MFILSLIFMSSVFVFFSKYYKITAMYQHKIYAHSLTWQLLRFCEQSAYFIIAKDTNRENNYSR